jgi:adenine-specific DNA-methyltransferase
VDPLPLHIHERISAQAILKVAARQDIERSLFADPEQAYHEAVQFYQHDIDWTNRLILGDSLQVMASLARREDLAGRVQMIYIDPPYGIKFASNFQPEIRKRDVKDKEQDLTREPEMIKAYRDTWSLGIHSYLSYLRDRFCACKELLADTGSIFIQMGEENVHVVRSLLDEIFGTDNFLGQIAFATTGGQSTDRLGNVFNHLLWYAKDKQRAKYRQIYFEKELREGGGWAHSRAEFPDGRRENIGVEQVKALLAQGNPLRPYSQDGTGSQGATQTGSGPFDFQGRSYDLPANTHWKTSEQGMQRLAAANRLEASENSLRYVRFLDDFPVQPITNVWDDTNRPGYIDAKRYVVQTSTKVIERCILMTSEPGDLVLDPTGGSGTTALVAEQWGRRWMTVDTSRVAIAIARQRLLTARFDFYRLLGESTGVVGGFKYKTVPHITLKSIAQNTNLDPIFVKHEPALDARLATCNEALAAVDGDLRRKLCEKLLLKQKHEGRRAVTEADRRRWELPQKGKGWEHWQVPFDTDPDYPEALSAAVKAYREAWRAKMAEVNSCIAANAEPEELVDQPEVAKNIVRVSGPFTVEAVQPPEVSLGQVLLRPEEGMFDGEPESLEDTFAAGAKEAKNVEAYLDQMIRLLRTDGVRFPNNKQMRFTRLDPLEGNETGLHAEGRWTLIGEPDPDPEGRATVCAGFGPQYGPVTAPQVEELIRAASRRGYDDLVIAGFNFDGAAQAVIQETQHPKLRIHMAHIRPDVNPGMSGLLKERPGSQLFTVFGDPRTTLDGPDRDSEYTVRMEGVDIYDPVNNVVISTGAEKVAAWFLDSDFDGRTFCITQAFFPDRNAWDKLSKALADVVDPGRFEALSGTVSLPFRAGKYNRIAVKLIDPRGNEVMRIHKLAGGQGGGRA